MGELRKTVIDETQKVTQKTQDFAASLRRDLAVTAAPFAMKVLGDAGKEDQSNNCCWLLFGAAVFVTLSFVLQWRINEAYFASRDSFAQGALGCKPYIATSHHANAMRSLTLRSLKQ